MIELLVSTLVLSILVVMLASVLASVTNLSSQASAKLDAVRLGREIFDLFGRDLKRLVIARPSLGANAPLQFWVSPAPPTATASGNNPQVDATCQSVSAVFWQASIARDQSAGNIAVIGYFVQNITSNRSQLRRVLIEPPDALYKIYSSPLDWLPSASTSAFLATSTSASSNKVDRGWAADGVVGLWVRCLDANGVPIVQNGAGTVMNYNFDSRLGFRTPAAASPSPTLDPTIYTTFSALPSFVDVGLVVVAPKDANNLNALPALPAAALPTSATSLTPTNFQAELDAYSAAISKANPRVKTATSLTRRFRLYGGN